MSKQRKPKKPVEVEKGLWLDLGCGPNPTEGFVGVDILAWEGKPEVVVTDLRNPWPWEDNSVEKVKSSHFIEHLDGPERIHFFNELYRVMRPGAEALIVTPHWASGRAYGDPTHKWPPVAEFFWFYLNAEWRKINAPHVGFTCNFEASWGHSFGLPWSAKTQEAQQFALNHYREVAQDMVATLVKRVPEEKK